MTTKMTSLIFSALLAFSAMNAQAHSEHEQHNADTSKLKLENLMKATLARVENTEVIVSRVTIPPNTTLPKHWHPGEEFAYVIEGSVTLWQQGKQDILGKAGEAMKVPLKQIHTAKTTSEGAVILVFRVHQSGQPERIKVE